MADREFLLDASAMLAALRGERGADRVAAVLDRATIHSVQIAEVAKKLADVGASQEDMR